MARRTFHADSDIGCRVIPVAELAWLGVSIYAQIAGRARRVVRENDRFVTQLIHSPQRFDHPIFLVAFLHLILGPLFFSIET